MVQEIGEDWKVGRVPKYTERKKMGKHKEREEVVVVRTKVRNEQCRGNGGTKYKHHMQRGL